jgi:hypothetical protein
MPDIADYIIVGMLIGFSIMSYILGELLEGRAE